MADIENHENFGQNEEDSLYGELNKARIKKQKADDAEKILLQIKNKIDQARLGELNSDIQFLRDS